MSTYSVVLFSDIYRPLHGKGMGVYRLANHLRENGYKTGEISNKVGMRDIEVNEGSGIKLTKNIV